jgi:hypothetical protein
MGTARASTATGGTVWPNEVRSLTMGRKLRPLGRVTQMPSGTPIRMVRLLEMLTSARCSMTNTSRLARGCSTRLS